MPLKKGSSSKIVSSNIGEMVKSFKKTGKIGESSPKDIKQALRQATAIAYSSAGKTKKLNTGGAVRSVYRKDAFKKTKIY
jgi:hypothetical protein